MRRVPPESSARVPRHPSSQRQAAGPSKERASGPAESSSRIDPVLHYAFRLLSYRDRSEKEMVGRLRMKGFDDSSIGKAVERLRSGGFLNDRKLATSLKRYAEESKHLGVLGTKRFLAGRGVPRDVLEEVIVDIDEPETARKLIEKKIASWSIPQSEDGNMELPPAMVRKLYGILARRGFLPETIRKTLRQIKYKEDTE